MNLQLHSTSEVLPPAHSLVSSLSPRYYAIHVEGYGQPFTAFYVKDYDGTFAWYTNYAAKIVGNVTHWCDIMSVVAEPVMICKKQYRVNVNIPSAELKYDDIVTVDDDHILHTSYGQMNLANTFGVEFIGDVWVHNPAMI